ncbi:MAG: phosphatidylglycerophosphatase A [Kiritimatiellia bacterium]|jgi:phosphatidylglycerophosphatase A
MSNQEQPQPQSFLQRITIAVATGFGLGKAPVASGTFGALLGLPLALGVTVLHEHLYLQISICAALSLLAVPICDAAERFFGEKDDGRIVADEYLTLPICVIGLPIARMMREGQVMQGLSLLGTAFVLSRICDILKPTPARQLQRVKGGLGIVLDDVFASFYALILTYGAQDFLLVPHVYPLFN